jgi:hypothetical protein
LSCPQPWETFGANVQHIHALPEDERQQAIADFRSIVATLGDAYRTSALVEVDRVAAHETATSAMEAGENVQVVANFHGITTLAFGVQRRDTWRAVHLVSVRASRVSVAAGALVPITLERAARRLAACQY